MHNISLTWTSDNQTSFLNSSILGTFLQDVGTSRPEGDDDKEEEQEEPGGAVEVGDPSSTAHAHKSLASTSAQTDEFVVFPYEHLFPSAMPQWFGAPAPQVGAKKPSFLSSLSLIVFFSMGTIFG